MVIKALIVGYYKQDLKIIVKTDSSDYVSNRIFSHLGKNRLLYTIACFSKNLNSAYCNYEIYDIKLLIII